MNTMIIILLALLFIKHFLVDFVFQTNTIAEKKGEQFNYLFIHALIHTFASALVLVFFTSITKTITIILFELIFHILFDFIKASKRLLGRFTFPHKLYFVSFGFDQLLHQLGYLVIVWAVFFI